MSTRKGRRRGRRRYSLRLLLGDWSRTSRGLWVREGYITVIGTYGGVLIYWLETYICISTLLFQEGSERVKRALA